MNYEIKAILDYLKKFTNDKEEITKYGCEISVKQAKLLLDYITNLQNELKFQKEQEKDYFEKHTKLLKDYTNLQKENEHLRTQVNTYENPDDYTLFYMWLDAKAKDKMKQLQEENERLKEENILLKASEPMSKLAEDYGYKSRCEKAIEYINKNKHLNWYVESIFTDELLKILGGDE